MCWIFLYRVSILHLLVLKSKPSQKDLDKISKKIGDKWRSLLTNLGEEEATIEGFLVISLGKTSEVCFKGLVHWLEGNADGPVIWETLLKALKESELKGFADDLEKKITRYVLRLRVLIIYVARMHVHTYLCTCTIICRTSVCMLALRLVRYLLLSVLPQSVKGRSEWWAI